MKASFSTAGCRADDVLTAKSACVFGDFGPLPFGNHADREPVDFFEVADALDVADFLELKDFFELVDTIDRAADRLETPLRPEAVVLLLSLLLNLLLHPLRVLATDDCTERREDSLCECRLERKSVFVPDVFCFFFFVFFPSLNLPKILDFFGGSCLR